VTVAQKNSLQSKRVIVSYLCDQGEWYGLDKGDKALALHDSHSNKDGLEYFRQAHRERPPETNMNNKYLLSEKKEVNGRTLHRIQARTDIGLYARVGQFGGWIEKEENLSESGDAWVSGEAEVFGEAHVFGDALVFGNASVGGNARVSGNARVGDSTWITDKAWVSDDALVSGRAQVLGYARIEDSAWVSDNALIGGKVRVSGYARVGGHARLVGDEWVSEETKMLD